MKKVCAWCGTVMEDDGDGPVSHGMCDDCEEKFEEEAASA